MLFIITKKNKIEVVLLGVHLHCNGEKGQKHLAFLKKQKYSKSLTSTHLIHS